MKWSALALFLVLGSAQAGLMSQIDDLARGAINQEFSQAKRVDIEDLTLDVRAQSRCDVKVESLALVRELGLEDEQKTYDCLTCLVKVSLKSFEIKNNRCLLMN